MNDRADTDRVAAAPDREVFAHLGELRVLPVATFGDARTAVAAVGALVEGGLDAVEITFRTSAATDSLEAVRAAFPELLLGAGTVVEGVQLEAAAAVGVDFVVSPGCNPDVISAAHAVGVPIAPGVCTPTEIDRARGMGVSVMKLFPAEPAGGTNLLRAFRAPFEDVQFIPTGGIGEHNLADYLAVDNVLACGGSWLLPNELLEAGDYGGVVRLARNAVRIADEARQ